MVNIKCCGYRLSCKPDSMSSWEWDLDRHSDGNDGQWLGLVNGHYYLLLITSHEMECVRKNAKEMQLYQV